MEGRRANLDSAEPKQANEENQAVNRILLPRLKRILEIPGISDKERKLLESNLKRLLEAQKAEQG